MSSEVAAEKSKPPQTSEGPLRPIDYVLFEIAAKVRNGPSTQGLTLRLYLIARRATARPLRAQSDGCCGNRERPRTSIAAVGQGKAGPMPTFVPSAAYDRCQRKLAEYPISEIYSLRYRPRLCENWR